MLYLFGRLALSDSLAYHEDFLDDDYAPGMARSEHRAEPDARAAAVSRRLRRGRHCPQPGRASASRID